MDNLKQKLIDLMRTLTDSICKIDDAACRQCRDILTVLVLTNSVNKSEIYTLLQSVYDNAAVYEITYNPSRFSKYMTENIETRPFISGNLILLQRMLADNTVKLDSVSARQLRAIFTVNCLLNNIEADTKQGDSQAHALYSSSPSIKLHISYHDFDNFIFADIT